MQEAETRLYELDENFLTELRPVEIEAVIKVGVFIALIAFWFYKLISYAARDLESPDDLYDRVKREQESEERDKFDA